MKFVFLRTESAVMRIERTEKEIVIHLPNSMDVDELQRIINYLRFREITSQSTASETDIENLVSEVKKARRKKIS